MRIIAGEARGRRLQPLQGNRVRPTSDRVREAIFSILAARYGLPADTGTRVLDLFAGSGALSLEALSRGALQATLVDEDAAAVETIIANARSCGMTGRVDTRRGRVVEELARIPAQRRAPGDADAGLFDLVFLDPPYAATELMEETLAALRPPLLSAEAVVVAEHPARQAPPEAVGGLRLDDRRRWGDTGVSFYLPETARTTAPRRSVIRS